MLGRCIGPSMITKAYYSREIESVEGYEKDWVSFFKSAPDLFELYRGLNNTFSFDIVPTVPILREAMYAARRLNCLPTAIRVMAGVRGKVENEKQYLMYLDALKPIRIELGIPTPEELGV